MLNWCNSQHNKWKTSHNRRYIKYKWIRVQLKQIWLIAIQANGRNVEIIVFLVILEDLDYIAQHTSVSREDVSMRFDAFIKHHPDGKINRKDFRSMITTCYPEMNNCKKLEKHIFRMYDTDGDGTIDFREFMILLYIMSSGTAEENLGQIFRIFDKNNDGSIT